MATNLLSSAQAQSANAPRTTSLKPWAGSQEIWAQIKQQVAATTPVSDAYTWFSQQNLDKVQYHLLSAQLAHQFQLPTQLELHTQGVIRYITKDMAEGTQAWVWRDLHYEGRIYGHPENLALPATTFVAQGQLSRALSQSQWRFQPIHAFAQMIPLDALQAMNLVVHSVTPAQAYWVADPLPAQVTQQPHRDPLLFAQYGRWFANLAFWI